MVIREGGREFGKSLEFGESLMRVTGDRSLMRVTWDMNLAMILAPIPKVMLHQCYTAQYRFTRFITNYNVSQYI